MIEVKSIKLEDGIEYMVMDEIDSGSITYYFLSNIEDEEDFCVRKIDKDIDDQLLVGLDSDEEFTNAMLLFTTNNKGVLE